MRPQVQDEPFHRDLLASHLEVSEVVHDLCDLLASRLPLEDKADLPIDLVTNEILQESYHSKLTSQFSCYAESL